MILVSEPLELLTSVFLNPTFYSEIPPGLYFHETLNRIYLFITNCQYLFFYHNFLWLTRLETLTIVINLAI